MKKTSARIVPNPGRVGRRVLKLAQETVRMLSADELARAAGGSGCITPSWTTDHPIGGNTVGC